MWQLDGEMNNYLETLFRRKELFLIPFLITPLIALAGTLYVGKQYEVGALIWVDSISFLDPLGRTQAGANEKEAQALREWLATEAFRKEVMERVGLAYAIERKAWPVPSGLVLQLERTGVTQVPVLRGVLKVVGLALPATTDEAVDMALGMMKKTLRVTTEGSNLLRITYQGKDPRLGKRMVEDVVSLYQEETLEKRTREAETGIYFYTRQFRIQEERLKQANDALQQFLLVTHPDPIPGQTRPPTEEAELENLRRAYLLEQTLYESTLRKLEQIRIDSEAAISNRDLSFQIIDAPQEPELAGFGKRAIAMTLILGIILGTILGLVPIILMTWQDGTVRTAADIERIVQPAFVAHAPLLSLNGKHTALIRDVLAQRTVTASLPPADG